jgi:amino acid transporter
MSSSHRLSLAAGVLININIMVGSGIFINTVLLAQLAGVASAITYILVGLLILPLMVSFACLAHMHHGGSLYNYGARLHSYLGFFSAWGYTITKLASCGVAIHVCTTLLSSIIPVLVPIPILACDMVVLSLFTFLNCCHVHIGKKVQGLFVIGKMIPIGTVLIVGSWYFSYALVQETFATSFTGIVTGIPFVLYAFMGFEASAGFNRHLVDPKRDGWRVMAIAFVIGVAVTTLFQWLLFGSIPHIEELASYREVFPALLSSWHLSAGMKQMALILLHGGIAASAAGVGFGILYANAGNIGELASYKFLPNMFVCRSTENTPVNCLILEALIVAGFLFTGHQSLPLLQQLAAFGATCTYIVSVIALLREQRASYKIKFIAIAGLISCSVLLGAALRNFWVMSMIPLWIFIIIHFVGLLLYLGQSRSTAELV